LFAVLHALSQGELLILLAVCTVCCIGASTDDEAEDCAGSLAALDPDMGAVDTASTYFAQLPKGKIIKAVKCFSPAYRPDMMKKNELARSLSTRRPERAGCRRCYAGRPDRLAVIGPPAALRKLQTSGLYTKFVAMP
jgi:hypothetical protein